MNVAKNEFGDPGLKAIAEMIRYHKVLQDLDVSKNSVSLDGWTPLTGHATPHQLYANTRHANDITPTHLCSLRSL